MYLGIPRNTASVNQTLQSPLWSLQHQHTPALIFSHCPSFCGPYPPGKPTCCHSVSRSLEPGVPFSLISLIPQFWTPAFDISFRFQRKFVFFYRCDWLVPSFRHETLDIIGSERHHRALKFH